MGGHELCPLPFLNSIGSAAAWPVAPVTRDWLGRVGCLCDAPSHQLDQGDHVVGDQLSGTQLVAAYLSPSRARTRRAG